MWAPEILTEILVFHLTTYRTHYTCSDSLLCRMEMVSVYGVVVDKCECCWNVTVADAAADTNSPEMASKRQLLRWKRSTGIILSSWVALTLSTAITQTIIPAIQMKCCSFCSGSGEKARQGRTSSVGPWKNYIVIRIQRHWFPEGDEPVSQSSSPWTLRVLTFPVWW